MSTPDSETRALKRLSGITWKADGDGYITMAGYFTPQGAKDLVSELGDEAREALGLVFLAGHTKAVMKQGQAEKIFALEGLPLNVQEKVRAL
jgi:hypothetical protein